MSNERQTIHAIALRFYETLRDNAKVRFDEYAGIFQFEQNLSDKEATIQAYLEMTNEMSAEESLRDVE